MADELKVMARKLSQPIKGDLVQIQGAHIRPASGLVSIDAGNSESFVVPEGTDYLHLTAVADIWFIVASSATDAVVDRDQFLPEGQSIEIGEIYESGTVRKIRAGDVVKCVLEA